MSVGWWTCLYFRTNRAHSKPTDYANYLPSDGGGIILSTCFTHHISIERKCRRWLGRPYIVKYILVHILLRFITCEEGTPHFEGSVHFCVFFSPGELDMFFLGTQISDNLPTS